MCTYEINIPICFHRLITDFLLSYHLDLFTNDDVVGSAPRTISLSNKTFQGVHVSDLPAAFHPPYKSAGSLGLLSDESRALTVSITNLQGAILALTCKRTMVDSVLHALRAPVAFSQASVEPQSQKLNAARKCNWE
ncbi:uncharacterized protein E5676_scaffold242G00630 [Cucumis melo var. makuwa]|uniref:Uncharacterized protein n=1 Tax=Cucumis melo var. makuwa TaxID=1194695 RepID=A0A5A7THP9_CUCMM|nr:uncharacterized protein E6C27_scaffold93G00520 [Cucumis melo var. makuwa]TYK19670.1 uncharacterized protein E5676_scaffold242G00630 [Cucumis melo var. makuwa]